MTQPRSYRVRTWNTLPCCRTSAMSVSGYFFASASQMPTPNFSHMASICQQQTCFVIRDYQQYTQETGKQSGGQAPLVRAWFILSGLMTRYNFRMLSK